MIDDLGKTCRLDDWRCPMNDTPSEQALEQRVASSLMDVLIRAGLILAMVMLCYQIFSRS